MLLTIIKIKPLYYVAILGISIYIIYGAVLVADNTIGVDTYLAGSFANLYYGYQYSLLL